MDKSMEGINYWYTEEMDGWCFSNGTNVIFAIWAGVKNYFLNNYSEASFFSFHITWHTNSGA